MKTVVIGGTGLIGSKTVVILRQRGHEVIAASPNTGVNTITGEGLKEALAGAQVVVFQPVRTSFGAPNDKGAAPFAQTQGFGGSAHHFPRRTTFRSVPGRR
jgi:uncharacterized protein YbjT (DUF2867 family)